MVRMSIKLTPGYLIWQIVGDQSFYCALYISFLTGYIHTTILSASDRGDSEKCSSNYNGVEVMSFLPLHLNPLVLRALIGCAPTFCSQLLTFPPVIKQKYLY